MDSECREFLRLLTINAHYQKGYGQAGRRLPDMISHWDGSILPEAERQFEKTAEWRQYQDLLLEVAEAQTPKDKQSDSTAMNRDGAARLKKSVIGSNVDKLRKECGWSFNDLAHRTGLDKKLILGHVNAGKGIWPNTLKIYADAFSKRLERKVSVAELENYG